MSSQKFSQRAIVIMSAALFLAGVFIAIPVSIAPAATSTPSSSTMATTPLDLAEKSKQVDAIFASFVTEDSPGGVVIVVQDGQILYKAGYGLADMEEGTPITVQSIFHLGSVGKQFTALAVMMLAEEGKLKYDDPIGEYLPELARFGDDLTIRHLLHHTSGIPGYYDDGELNEKLLEAAEMPTNEDALALLSEMGEMQFTPGETFSYSNAGYDMLGSLIEQVSGQSYAAFMQERIFDPLGMEHTFSQPNSERLNDPDLVHSYVREGDQIEAYDSDPFDYLVGSGSFYTTVEDMALYDQALYTDKLIKQSTLAEAFEPALLNNGIESRYGFGWELGRNSSERYVAHSGEWLGFSSYYARFPEQRLAVIILTNRTYDLPGLGDIAFEIADLYLNQCP